LFFIFFVVNIFFLSQYPFVHSDEPWLSGLSGAIIEAGSFITTEPFFDLLPRYPHAIKVLFHALQIPLIALFDNTPFSVRLLSLLAATAALWLFHRITRAGLGERTAGLLTLLLALDIQFIYQAHFARQEMLLLTVLLGAGLCYMKSLETGERRWIRLCAAAIALSIGIHPNSFLISLVIGGFLLVDLSWPLGMSRRQAAGRFAEYTAILALGALLFVALSFWMDPDFLRNYGAFGRSVGVAEPLYMKFFRFPDFYAKLYHGISGTYYTPDIRLQFFLFAVALAGAVLQLFFHPQSRPWHLRLIAGLLMLNLGTLVLGKYSQPSIILHFPLYLLLLGGLIKTLGTLISSPRWRITVAAIIIGAAGFNSAFNLAREFHLIGPKANTEYESYRDYTENIGRYIPPEATVLANLNTQYYFSAGQLYDFRNLAFLDDRGLTFSGYMRSRGIEYILYPEEMDYIYQHRPVWNILYGNLYPYYRRMQDFLSAETELLGNFSSPVYGMRIAKLSGTRNWQVRVYRVLPDSGDAVDR